jgi:xylan 1,4-beta-xylosidase
VRFHGIFDDDMSVILGDSESDLYYSYFNVDSVYDFLLSIGMQPLVEMSFMPELIASGPDTIFHYKGTEYQ